MAEITISDDNLKQILLEIGCPPLDPTQLEISVADIKSLCISPAMFEYFIWNPICLHTEQEIAAGAFSVPAPDASVIGIVDARLVPLMSRSSMQTTSPFMNAMLFNVNSNRSMRGAPGACELLEAKAFERRYAQSIEEVYGSKKIQYDPTTRMVTGYATSPSELNITWGKMSNVFEDIDSIRQKEAMKLAKAYTLRAFGQVRAQQNNNTGVEWNYQLFLDRADKLEEEVTASWKSRTKVVVVRR